MGDRSDLEFLRDVAASGLHAPSLSGRFFIWWGGLAAPALLAHWAILTGLVGIPAHLVGLVWMAYGIIGMVGSSLLGRSLQGKPGAGAVNNRGESAAWRGVTWMVAAYAIGAVVAMGLGRGSLLLFDTIPLVAFAGYGLSFHVSAQLGGARWMQAMAVLAWVASGAGLTLVGTTGIYLFAAVAVAVLAIIPGIVLLRGEPATEA
ncbi:hypothetical protein [Maricaulis sp.]|uniref:hypothetical protein n=1 Tax=Maricaulis sp. TaxID=1486257 RepID=UPI0025BC4686|nr:hypothetical protein [Maricaulis sp.]